MEIFYETCISKKLSLLARVRFFDQFLSGASLFVCPSVHICFLIVYFSSRTTGMISTKLDPKQHWVKEVSFFFGFFYMKGHAFFKGIQFVFIDTLFLLFKESSSQKPLNQKSCILCRNILRWYRFTFVHIMIPVGSVGPRWVQGFNFLHRNMLRNFVLQYFSQQASGQKCCDMCGVV